jgi:TPR repeat protein
MWGWQRDAEARRARGGADAANDALRDKYLADKRVEFEASCNAGDAGGCYSLGEWWLYFGKDRAKAEALFKGACHERKHGNACFALAQVEQSRPEGSDPAIIWELTRKACEYGNRQACGTAGALRLKGRGCGKDAADAQRLFALACEENDSAACFNLGRLLLDGDKDLGVKRDAAKAFPAMLRACQLGHANGCQVVSVMYKKGEGVAASEEQHELFKQRTLDIVKQSGQAFFGVEPASRRAGEGKQA